MQRYFRSLGDLLQKPTGLDAVDALQQYFRTLSDLNQADKGSGELRNELGAIDKCLAPFAGQPLKKFAEFLDKARTYDPEAVVARPAPRKSTKAPRVKVDVDGIAATVKHLFDNAKNPEVSIESIDEKLTILDPLSKANLLVVARAIHAESGLSKKTGAEVLRIIKQAVRDMWGSARRVKQ
jgi:hypothetical protein